MELTNFYIDEKQKSIATQKINNLLGDTTKGQFSALLRTLVQEFVECDDATRLQEFAAKVKENYTYSVVRNKRSKL